MEPQELSSTAVDPIVEDACSSTSKYEELLGVHSSDIPGFSNVKIKPQELSSTAVDPIVEDACSSTSKYEELPGVHSSDVPDIIYVKIEGDI